MKILYIFFSDFYVLQHILSPWIHTALFFTYLEPNMRLRTDIHNANSPLHTETTVKFLNTNLLNLKLFSEHQRFLWNSTSFGQNIDFVFRTMFVMRELRMDHSEQDEEHNLADRLPRISLLPEQKPPNF